MDLVVEYRTKAIRDAINTLSKLLNGRVGDSGTARFGKSLVMWLLDSYSDEFMVIVIGDDWDKVVSKLPSGSVRVYVNGELLIEYLS